MWGARTVRLRPHKNLATNSPSKQPIKPSLMLAATSLPQPSFMLESKSTHTPVMPVMAASSMSTSKADADAEETLRKVMPVSSNTEPPDVRTVS